MAAMACSYRGCDVVCIAGGDVFYVCAFPLCESARHWVSLWHSISKVQLLPIRHSWARGFFLQRMHRTGSYSTLCGTVLHMEWA